MYVLGMATGLCLSIPSLFQQMKAGTKSNSWQSEGYIYEEKIEKGKIVKRQFSYYHFPLFTIQEDKMIIHKDEKDNIITLK